MIKTLTLNHYDQTFELQMVNGSKHEITISNQDRIGTNFSDEPYTWEESPKYLLERWIESGSVVGGLNLSHVVKFTSGEIANEREEQITYRKHWFWGWRKDD